jgi:hypothetical protein
MDKFHSLIEAEALTGVPVATLHRKLQAGKLAGREILKKNLGPSGKSAKALWISCWRKWFFPETRILNGTGRGSQSVSLGFQFWVLVVFFEE